MALTLTEKIIKNHLVDGTLTPEEEIAIRIDQTLTQDATGTMVMLELEAFGLEQAKTEVSVQYVDHNLIQEDYRNPDDHRFLKSACEKFGLWYSRPGNGISHPLHMQYFGAPGKSLLGADSHTCAAGSLGMLAMGAGGLDVATAIAGEPYYLDMPKTWGVELTGSLPDWVSAKDVILELLRRHDVKGGVGYIIEYFGDGLKNLSAMDRHVIANMGAELGATTTIFPSDEQTKLFLTRAGRPEDWQALSADKGCEYQKHETIELNKLEPLIAKPTSPGNVVPVKEIAGQPLYQSYIGSSANPGFRDFAMVAEIVKDTIAAPGVSLDINPSTRNILEELVQTGHLGHLVHSGARIHQAGCNGCIGMGQAPASGQNSLRTTPRNFPGRSGTQEDSVFLCSPETAAASALTGVITDPRTLEQPYPQIDENHQPIINKKMLQQPAKLPQELELVKGPNITSIPDFQAIPDAITLPILLKMNDNVSTDEISPAGAKVLPFRSNIEKISDFSFTRIDKTYPEQAKKVKDHCVIGGENYGQGSSREHAALAPRFLGLRVVIVKSFARIHLQNLSNFGVLPLTFTDPGDYDALKTGDKLVFENLHKALKHSNKITAKISSNNQEIQLEHALSEREVNNILAGGVINAVKAKLKR